MRSFSAQTGVGNKGKWGDAICSINSVLNLCTICQFDEAVVEYFILGMCQVSVNQYASSVHNLTTFQANTLDREYTLEYGLGTQDGVARPFLKGRMNTNIKFNITSKMWEMRHLHSPNYALLTDPRAKGGSVYPVGRWRVSSLFHLTMLCRYKWLVFNPECNTINKEISLTLSRSYKASVKDLKD